MVQQILCVLFLSLPFAVFSQIPLGIGEWRTHVPYKNASSLTDAGNKIYVSANAFFFSYDKEYKYVQRFDKISGLSDVGVSFVNYNSFDSTLLVVYDNANIDLIQDNVILNISDIKRKQIVGDKTIYSAYFIDHLAYLSCGFGIIVLDMAKKEIKDTYRIGSNGTDKRVFSFTADSLNFYAATEEGLKTADRNSINLANYNEWNLVPGLPARISKNVVEFNGRIFAEIRDTLYANPNNSWSYYFSRPNWKIKSITVSNNHMTICELNDTASISGRITIVESDYECCELGYYDVAIRYPFQSYVDVDGTVWVAEAISGLVRINEGNIQPGVFPLGLPNTRGVQNMSAERGQLWVAHGGGGPAISNQQNRDGVSSFIENWWSNYNQYSNPELSNFLSVYEVAVHPTAETVYFGSWWGGLGEFSNNTFLVYDKDNSILLPSEDGQTTLIGGLAFDSQENLWMTSFGSERPIIVKRADGTWESYLAPGVDGNWLTQVIVDDYDQKWIIISKTNSQGILAFKEKSDNSSSNFYKILSSGAGNGNLPTNDVQCLAKDLDGEIWVGTGQGVAVFYCPSAVFTNQGCEAQQIIVTQNGVAGYLLETEGVHTIAVDGANRKWMGTSNGVFLLSPDGTEQIAHYTIDNSPLLSNEIIDITIDQQTGEVFIGTEKGIVSIRGEATGGEEENNNVLVFPNPVRENYEGPIAIKGLANNSNVKITDVNGMLFYETTALGGQAVWDGRNYNGDKAKTGVYLIFSSNEDGSSSHVTKLLIIN